MKLRFITALIVMLATLLTMSGVAARPPAPGGLVLSNDSGGVQIEWSIRAADLAAARQDASPPAQQLIALRLPDGADPTPQLVAMSQAWLGPPPLPAALPTRRLIDGSSYPPLPGFAPQPAPAAPLALLREGRLRGQRIAVYALSPLYLGTGGAQLLTELRAYLPRAALLDPAAPWTSEPSSAFLADAAPPDPIAARSSWAIRVTQGGVQSLSAAAIQAAGLSLAGIDPARLRLWRQGATVPLDLRTSSGALSELRFYAPAPGDRYNSADIYWLTVEAAAGSAMASANAQPTGGLPCQSTALGRGTWRLSALYDSRLPGPDDDHYFAAELRAAAAPASPDSITASLSSSLPRASGPITLTLAGDSLFSASHTLSVTLAGTALSTAWSGPGIFLRSLKFPAGAERATVALMPGAAADRVHLDSVSWEARVQLSFAGRGAAFVGESGPHCYSLSGLPAGATLYDVTDPAAPLRLITGASSFEADSQALRSYLLAGPGTLHTPAITARAAVDLAAPLNAEAIYIAPDEFVAPLAPLVARRVAQGYSVAVVRAQAIYDGWGGGQASPAAIRSFLRYAAATWSVKPIAVTLVGDGNSDPRNYLGIGQTSWIPPYLAPVDPGLNETACENCFVQLDGDDPLSDALPDLLLGRLPVKSADELSMLVQKIAAYESSGEIGAWRGRAIILADNADNVDARMNDFPTEADESIAELPASVEVERVYYDPGASAGDPAWRLRDSYAAFQRTMDYFNSGAATLSYLGHGLAYQWAYTGLPLDPDAPQDRQYLLNVDFAGDLTNGVRLPIVLSLTCLTGQFQLPSVRGTTIDEALLLNPNGGAIATWSSSGLGVLNGHRALQRGFMGALWGAPAGPPPRLGELTMAGYQELFINGGCCHDALRTYGLLGDPLTIARVQTGIHALSLPIVRR